MRKKPKNEEWITRKAEMWIAREKNFKELYLYPEKPEKNLWNQFVTQYYDGVRIPLPPLMFDEIIFENSPVKVEMKMKILVPKEGY